MIRRLLVWFLGLLLLVLSTAPEAAAVNLHLNFFLPRNTGGFTYAPIYQPGGVAVDAARNFFYVADTDNNCILKFSTSGTLLATWGRQGTVIGEFLAPMGVAVDSGGNVYVADTDN